MVDSGAARAITSQAKDKVLGADTGESADLFGIDMGGPMTASGAALVEGERQTAVADAAPAKIPPKSGVRRGTAPSATSATKAKTVASKAKPEKRPAAAKAARVPSPVTQATRTSPSRARKSVDAETLVTQKELDARDIGGPTVAYWESACLLMPGPKKGTWLATQEAMRRINRCTLKAPIRRRRS